MSITRTDVLNMLANYRELARQAAQYEFEIQNYQPMATDEDVMDSMLFGQTSGGIVAKGHISNKTEVIALSYNDRVEALNIKELYDLQCDLRAATLQMSRIRHYISLLDKRQSEVLTLIYVNGMLLIEAAEKLGIASKTLRRSRDFAVDRLVEMFQRVTTR